MDIFGSPLLCLPELRKRMLLGSDILGLWAMSTAALRNLHGSLCLQERGQASQPGRAFHQLASIPFMKRLSPVSLPMLHLRGLFFHVWSLKSFHFSSPSSNVIFSMKLLQNPQNDSSSSNTITECLDWSFCICPGLGLPHLTVGSWSTQTAVAKVWGFHIWVYIRISWVGGLLEYQYRLRGPIPRILDSVDLQWDLVVCISNRCPGDPDAAGMGSTLQVS